MREIKRFPEAPYAAVLGDFNLDFSGRVFDELLVSFDGIIASSAQLVAHADAPFRLLGTVELNQAENPLLRLRAEDLRHLAALTKGGYGPMVVGAPNNTTAAFYAQAALRLSALQPRARVNASEIRAFFRGQFQDRTAYGTNTVAAGTLGRLRPTVFSAEIDGPWARPAISQASVGIDVAADNIEHVIKFETATLVSGLMLRAYDDSAFARVDGLVRSLQIEHNRLDGGPREIMSRQRWGVLRSMTAAAAGFSASDHAESTGVVYVPLIDRRNVAWGGALLVGAGESLRLSIDTQAAVESHITAVTPAANDRLYVTTVGFLPMSQALPQVAARDAERVRAGMV